MNFNFELNLKVSAFYLEKKKLLFLKKIFLGRTAKVHPKDGVQRIPANVNNYFGLFTTHSFTNSTF